MSEDGGLDEVEESFRAAASCAWRRATVASSAFSRASWASNSAWKRRQFGQDFRALVFMASYATSLTDLRQQGERALNRLVRVEVDLDGDKIRIYRLRRREP